MEPETQKQTSAINTPTAVIIGSIIIAVAVFFSDGISFKKEVDPEKARQKELASILQIAEDDYVRGNKDAEIIVYEYSDIDCPFCREFHNTMRESIEQHDDIAWVYRHLPLDSLHPFARIKSEAVECAGSLGGESAFVGLLDVMFDDASYHNVFDIEKAGSFVESLGVSKQDFEQCVSNQTFAEKVQSHVEQATKAGAQGTPFSIIATRAGEILLELPGYVDTATMNQILNNPNLFE